MSFFVTIKMFNDELNVALPSRMIPWFCSMVIVFVTESCPGRKKSNHGHYNWQLKDSSSVIVFNWRIYTEVFVNILSFNINTRKSYCVYVSYTGNPRCVLSVIIEREYGVGVSVLLRRLTSLWLSQIDRTTEYVSLSKA